MNLFIIFKTTLTSHLIPVRRKVALLVLLKMLDILWPFCNQSSSWFSDGDYKFSTHTLSDDRIILHYLDLDTYVEIIKPSNDLRQYKTMMVIAPEDIIGWSFLSNPTDNGTIENGERHRAFVVKAIEDLDNEIAKYSACIKLICSFNDNQCQEIIAYNDIIRRIETDHDNTGVWECKRSTVYEGPLLPHRHNYKGSSYNVMNRKQGKPLQNPWVL